MVGKLKHWTPPDGPSLSHSRPWIAFRAAVRIAALRFCDRPTLIIDRVRGETEPREWSCGECEACEARELVDAGEV